MGIISSAKSAVSSVATTVKNTGTAVVQKVTGTQTTSTAPKQTPSNAPKVEKLDTIPKNQPTNLTASGSSTQNLDPNKGIPTKVQFNDTGKDPGWLTDTERKKVQAENTARKEAARIANPNTERDEGVKKFLADKEKQASLKNDPVTKKNIDVKKDLKIGAVTVKTPAMNATTPLNMPKGLSPTNVKVVPQQTQKQDPSKNITGVAPKTAYNKVLTEETATHSDFIAVTNITNPDVVNTKNKKLQDKVANLALTGKDYNDYVAPNSYMDSSGKVHVLTGGAKADKDWVKLTENTKTSDKSAFEKYYDALLTVPDGDLAGVLFSGTSKEGMIGIANAGLYTAPDGTKLAGDPNNLFGQKEQLGPLGQYNALKDRINKLSTDHVMPFDPKKQQEWLDSHEGSLTADRFKKSTKSLDDSAKKKGYSSYNDMVEKEQAKNKASFGKLIPGYNKLYDSEFMSKSEKRGEQVENFSIGLFEEVRQNPADILEMAALSYMGGAVLGKGAGLAAKGVTKLPKSFIPFVEVSGKTLAVGAGVAGDVAFVGMGDLYGQGKTIAPSDLLKGKLNVVEINEGMTYARGSPEYMQRIGSYTATDLIPGEIGMRKGFKQTYKAPVDMSAAKLKNDINIDNMVAKIKTNSQAPELKKYKTEALAKSNEKVARLQNDLDNARLSKKPTEAIENKISAEFKNREKIFDDIKASIEKDYKVGKVKSEKPKSIADVEKSMSRGGNNDMSFQQKAMEVYGGDVNKPELRSSGKANRDELLIGNRGTDEMFVGNRRGDWTQIFPGRTINMPEIPANALDDLFYPNIIRDKTGEANKTKYDPSNEYVEKKQTVFDPDFGESIKNLLNNPHATKLREENAHKLVDENAHNYRNKEEFEYPFRNPHEFGYEYERVRTPDLPPIKIGTLPGLPKNKKSKGKRKGAGQTLELKRDEYLFRNPFEKMKK